MRVCEQFATHFAKPATSTPADDARAPKTKGSRASEIACVAGGDYRNFARSDGAARTIGAA